MPVLQFIVPPAWDQKSLSSFLRGAHDVSGTILRSARRTEGGLTSDGALIRTGDPVHAGAVIAVTLPDVEREYPPYHGTLTAAVLYENDDLLVVDKPAAMPCHPAKGHFDDTLASYCAALPQLLGRAFRPVGRLDRDTSGVMLCARHPHSANWLGLAKNRPTKLYLALLCGAPPWDEQTISVALSRDAEQEDHRRRADPDGLHAVTHCKIMQRNDTHSLALLRLETGRTHQIRAHMAHIGHPLAGDSLYGGEQSLIARQALHCWHLHLETPEGNTIEVTAPLPEDFSCALRLAFGAQPAFLTEKGSFIW